MENHHVSSRVLRRTASSAGNPEKSIASEVGSIVVFGLAVFTLFALLTYYPSDPSLFSNAHGAARNACGKVGAYVASLFLQCFGVGAFLVPAALIFIAVTIFKRDGVTRFLSTLGGMAVATMSLTVFLSLQWKYWPYSGTLLLTGGAFGAWCMEILMRQFNPLGSSIVSMLFFCLALALSTPLSVARFGGKVLKITWTISWRFTKLLLSYAAYILGLAAVRLAHWMSELLQSAIEAAVRKTRSKIESRKKNADEERDEIEPATLLANTKGSRPASETGSEDEDEEVNPEIGPPELPGSDLGIGYAEAPNALPELEEPSVRAASARAPKSAPSDKGPEIHPAKEAAKMSEAAMKAAERLARASRALKGQWKLPLVDFLAKPVKVESEIDKERLLENARLLKQKFADFGIDGDVTAVRPGPVITLYEFKPGPGIKLSRIAALQDDLSMALAAQSVRILAPLPGKAVVGIEIPSPNRETVFLRELLQHPDFYGPKHAIPIAMGKDIAGSPVMSDLGRMPHLLCAGRTGSGKSVFMNSLICSLVYRFTPDDLRMILVDPKFIEFRSYADIPHLLLPVVDDPKQASTALKWTVREMDRRYRILSLVGARNLASFNHKVGEMGAAAMHDLLLAEENTTELLPGQTGGDWIEAFEPGDDGAPKIGKLPYIVVIIDELADLMMVAKKDVEHSIIRLAQKARAAGIHLVAATQRPSTDVITGLIKANLPSRVSFQLASYVDSKTILDRGGAEKLLGNGDMLFIPPETVQITRLHGAYVTDDEIGKLTGFLRAQGKPYYRDEILIEDEEEGAEGEEGEAGDELFEEAVELVKNAGHASASFLQRHLRVGYNRASRMIETMEAKGIVGPADGARPRDVLLR